MTGFFKLVSTLGNLLLVGIAALVVLVSIAAAVLMFTPGLGDSVFGGN
ncbi:hypothetical protein BH09ACT3_BH09ACT3_01180 [soil metagenome]